MHYTYVLFSEADRKLYIGASEYLKSGRGGRYLRARLASSLAAIRDNKLERH